MSGRSLRVSVLAAAVFALAAASMGYAAAAEPGTKLPLGSANTIVAIRIQSINTAVKAVTQLATAFQPEAAPAINMMITQQLAAFPGVDRAKPLAILILDPQKFDDPVVGIFPLLNPKAFAEGVKVAPVGVVGNLGIIGDHEGARTEVMAYLKAGGIKAVPAADMKSLAVASADSGTIVTRYKKQIVQGFEMMKVKVRGKPAAGGDELDIDNGAAEEKPALDPKRQEMVLLGVDYARKLVDAIEKQGGLVEIGLSADRNLITSKFSVDAIPGTPFATFLSKNNRPVNRALAKLLPKDAISSSVMAFDPASFSEMGLGVVNIGSKIFGLGEDEAAAINKAFADVMANASGLSAQAEVPVKGGIGGVALNGIKDKAVARSTTQAMLALAGQGALGEFLKKYGVGVSLTAKHREHRGIPVDKMEINVNADTLTAALPIEPPVRQMMKKQMETAFLMGYGHKSKLTLEVAYGKRLAATAYGPDHVNTMNKQIELMKAGGTGSIANVPAYQAALKGYPAGTFLFSHLSLFGKIEALGKMMAKNMGPMMGGMDVFPKRSELPAEEQFLGVGSSITGNRVLTEMRVPVKSLQAIVTVVKRKMAEQMRRRIEEMQKERKGEDPPDAEPFEDF